MAAATDPLGRGWRSWSPRRRAFVRTRVRRLAAAMAVGVAAWVVLAAALPAPPEIGVPVLVAARALPAGHTLAEGDTEVRRWPAELVPDGALRAPDPSPAGAIGRDAGSEGPTGRVLGGAMAAGEVLTRARLLGPGMLDGMPPGSVAVAVPLADTSLLALARPGDRVRVLVPGTGAAVAAGPVLVVEAPADGGLGSTRPGRLVLAVPPADASALAAATAPAGAGGGFLVVLTGPD